MGNAKWVLRFNLKLPGMEVKSEWLLNFPLWPLCFPFCINDGKKQETTKLGYVAHLGQNPSNYPIFSPNAAKKKRLNPQPKKVLKAQ